ncbi:hypothetical protein QA612_08005 [Evansella sp. AB-P1]|uniref:hypothetical protein n=1 Tax=Evansella sp. AB-P1 TaxID=3037653 RepID=UPI00241C71EC|nr:hypothetical protein [Evansella sp. AB-P1]MDG5787436.1 hypothetical protein [Evansella sp. AB-P1]
MNDIVSSYVIRIIRPSGNRQETKPHYRIKLNHVQTGDEMYLHSFEELKDYLEKTIDNPSNWNERV